MSGEPCSVCGARLSGSERRTDVCSTCQGSLSGELVSNGVVVAPRCPSYCWGAWCAYDDVPCKSEGNINKCQLNKTLGAQ